MKSALGLVEALGYTTAVAALDAASKAAEVTLVGVEKVIGVGEAVSVTILIAGEVAAVRAAVDAGAVAGNRVGTVMSSGVMPRPHEEVAGFIKKFEKNLKTKEVAVKEIKKPKNNKKEE